MNITATRARTGEASAKQRTAAEKIYFTNKKIILTDNEMVRK